MTAIDEARKIADAYRRGDHEQFGAGLMRLAQEPMPVNYPVHVAFRLLVTARWTSPDDPALVEFENAVRDELAPHVKYATESSRALLRAVLGEPSAVRGMPLGEAVVIQLAFASALLSAIGASDADVDQLFTDVERVVRLMRNDFDGDA